MAISPKVSAATVGASVSTLIIGILSVHVFPHGMAPDVQGLVSAAIVALVTFAAGWFARALPEVEKVVAKVEAAPAVKAADVVYTKVRQTDPVAVADVAKALEATVEHDAAPVASVVLPVAQATVRAL